MNYAKRPIRKYPQHAFCRQLRRAAKEIRHKELCEELGINIASLWKWMYSYVPRPLVIQALQPKLDKISEEIKNGN